MSSRRVLATAAASAVLVAAALVGCTPEQSGPAAPPPSTVSPSPAIEPIDTTTWTTYTSDRYGFKVGHPPDWNEIPASRDWRFDTDAKDPFSSGSDAFASPSDAVRVSVWTVPLDPGTSIYSIADIEAWVEEYCEGSGNAPCTGIKDRAVELCIEARDCHPGLLVPFRNDVQAFLSGGIYAADAMTIVAVWRAESAPAVAPYGGSQRLLEAFLSTMVVWPASTPFEERTCYGRPPSGLACQEAG